ncbi:MAG TPA: hypothetical protein VNG12_08300, partial [Acidimicrobiales bacterium]|nr:hypothetical protein [Acidimicrobiales bacterium]
ATRGALRLSPAASPGSARRHLSLRPGPSGIGICERALVAECCLAVGESFVPAEGRVCSAGWLIADALHQGAGVNVERPQGRKAEDERCRRRRRLAHTDGSDPHGEELSPAHESAPYHHFEQN